MMRFWFQTYAKSQPLTSGALVSVVAHVVIIGAAVLASRPRTAAELERLSEQLERTPFYIAPPDRSLSQPGTRETLRYVELAPPGPGAGLGASTVDVTRAFRLSDLQELGNVAHDRYTLPEAPTLAGTMDSVYSVLDVDSAAVRDPSSAAPVYPPDLQAQNIEGGIVAQYVVDTSGVADTLTFRVVMMSHPQFAAAVKAALPYMRFTPAKRGGVRVRQLVEQDFTFRLLRHAEVDTAKPAP